VVALLILLNFHAKKCIHFPTAHAQLPGNELNVIKNKQQKWESKMSLYTLTGFAFLCLIA